MLCAGRPATGGWNFPALACPGWPQKRAAYPSGGACPSAPGVAAAVPITPHVSSAAGASGGGIPAESMQVVADGVTQCKFEATYPASDECVLHKILDVLVACVGCPGGSLLTHDNLINIFQACYHIGHFQTEKGRDASGASACSWWCVWLNAC